MGRKPNRVRALELVALHGKTKKAVKVGQGISLEKAECNAGKSIKRFQQNIRA